MVIQNSVVKHTAKLAWKEKEMLSLAIGFVLLLSGLIVYTSSQLILMLLPFYVSVICFAILSFFWLLPLTLGILRTIWQQMFEGNSKFFDVFYYFTDIKFYKKALHFIFSLLIRVTGIVFVCILPAVAVDIISSEWIHTSFDWTMPLWISNLSVISSILYFVGGIISVAFSVRFYISPFLFVTDDCIDALEALHLSTLISKNNIWEFFLLILSFLGWFIISLFVFPLIIVIPYFLTCFMVFCRFVVAQYNKKQELLREYSYPADYKFL